MWPVFVVMPHVLVERGEHVPRVVDQDPVQAFPADRATHRSAYAFARGARGGVRTISMPSLVNTVPADLDVHVICDNYATHKTDIIQKWLTAHPPLPRPFHLYQLLVAQYGRMLVR
jgi:hypothetical protein